MCAIKGVTYSWCRNGDPENYIKVNTAVKLGAHLSLRGSVGFLI